MKKKDKVCCRKCRYCGKMRSYSLLEPCEYLRYTGRSRLKEAMQMLGVNRLTEEVEELLRPKNCPFFDSGPRRRRRTNPVTGVVRDA